jgi:transcriptional regulator with XRE-family HTH domain
MNATLHWQRKLAALRKEKGVSLRALASKAGVSPASLSAIERGQNSPTLATLNRILRALDSDFAAFFDGEKNSSGPVFSAQEMAAIEDANRRYTFLLPKKGDVHFEMVDETLLAQDSECEWEIHSCDMAGVVISGGPLRVEVAGRGEWMLREGDAFYIKAGQRHRGCNASPDAIRLLTVYCPPRY